MRRARPVSVVVCTIVLAFAGTATASAAPRASSSAERPDIAGTFDVGGRNMYLQCTGHGSPTVILISGGGIAADAWDSPLGEGPHVYPTIAKTTRVCAYDRPGTTRAQVEGGISRSDPVPQPVTPSRSVADLHALLVAAGQTGPFVLAAHSYGGLVARLYAHDYPRDVAGMVLVDSFSPELREAMGDHWASWITWNATPAALIADYPDYERVDFDAALDEVASNRSVKPMPLVVLTADKPYPAPTRTDVPADINVITRDAQDVSQRRLAQLVPGAEHITQTHSGHDIMIENPVLVSDSIFGVVAAVRDGRTRMEPVVAAPKTAKSETAKAAVQLTPVVQQVLSPPRWYPADDGRVHLQYELQLTNTVSLPIRVASIEVFGDGRRVDVLSGHALEAAMSPLGSETGTSTELPASSVALVWVDLGFASARDVPARVGHRLTVDVGPGLPVGPTIVDTGATAKVSSDAPVVIGPPLRGGRWVAAGGAAGPHRRAIQSVDGHLRLSQRFAVDFAGLLDADGRTHDGPADVNASYHNYGQSVLAVGDGTIVAAVDGLPEQVPNQNGDVPLADAGGNEVILQLGAGKYVGYGHLEPGSLRVEVGQRVRRGDVIGVLGNSGNSTGPHLHLQVMTAASMLDADGLPFVIDGFRLDGSVPSLDALLAADSEGTPMPIDAAHAGKQRDRGIAGLDVLTFPGRARLAVSGTVDIGGGRKLSVECRGTGSPTVVLISGKGNGAEDWQQVLDPADPAHEAPGDDVSAGMGVLERSDAAVLPSVARFTRVCAYDRPDVRTGNDVSTPRAQPHTVDADVRDLHALLAALHEPGPFVLVAHSYGGMIATLYARTYPHAIGGLVMVDAAGQQMEDVVSATTLKNWDEINATTSPQVREGVRVIDAFAKINASPPLPRVPAVVLSADKPYRTDLLPADVNQDDLVTFADWLAAQDRLATELHAEHIMKTDSGHNVYMYSPALVVAAIREVVDDVR